MRRSRSDHRSEHAGARRGTRAAVLLAALLLLLAACSPEPEPEDATAPGPELADLPPHPSLSLLETDLAAQAEPYDITLVTVGSPTPQLAAALANAAATWEGIVTHGLGDVANRGIPAGSCGDNPAYTAPVIDDVVIFAGASDIDGPGRILAQAGPCFIRTSDGLTVAGVLIFDSADLGAFGGQLTEIAVHEMGHILGVGTLWNRFGLLGTNRRGGLRYFGRLANREYRRLGGSGRIPIETDGGPGTAGGHWDEERFDDELMTGFLNGGVDNPLSRITVGTLADMGYRVAFSAAEPYALPENRSATGLAGQGTLLEELHEQLIEPSWRVD